MNEDVQKLVAVIEARSASAEKQMERWIRTSERKLAGFEASAKRSATKVETLMGTAFARIDARAKMALQSVAALFTFSGAMALARHVREAANRFDELGDTAERLETSAGSLVMFQHALNKSGGELKAFNGAADDFQSKIGAVISGVGKAKGARDALSAIGLSRTDMAKEGSLEGRLLLIADGISQVEDAASRAAIADKLGLLPMLPLLEKGRAGVEALTGEFKDLGAAANEGVRRTADMADKIADLEDAMQMKSDNLFVKLSPVLIEVYSQIGSILDLMNDPRWGRIATLESLFRFLPGFNAGMALGVAAPLPTKIEGYQRDIKNKRAEMRDTGVGYFGQIGPQQRAERNARLQKEISELEAAILREAVAGAAGGLPKIRKPKAPAPLLNDSAGEDEAADVAAKAAREAEDLAEASARAGKAVKEIGKDLLATYGDEQRAKLEETTQAMRDQADAAAAFKESFRGDFMQSWFDLKSGDWKQAAMSAADAFGDRLWEKLGNQVYDELWDAGLGGVAKDLFGDADLAQAAYATTTQAATSAMQTLTAAAYNAAAALNQSGALGGTGGILEGIAGGIGALMGGRGFGWAGVKGFFGGARALGGPVMAGRPYLVGENGAEPFVPSVNGRILSVPEAQAALRAPMIPQAANFNASAGGAPVTLNVTINNPTRDALPFIAAELAKLKASLPATIKAVANDGRGRRQVR